MTPSNTQTGATQCRGWRLIALVSAWAGVALLALIPAAASYARLLGEGSLDILFRSGVFAIDPEIATGLQDLGLGHDFLLTFDVAFRLVGMTIFTVTAAVIYVRKWNDWMTGLVSATLLLAGVTWFAPIQALEPGSLLLSLGQFVGNSLPFAPEFGGSLAGVLLVMFMFLFPDGRFIPKWSQYAVVAVGVHFVLWKVFPESIFNAADWADALQVIYVVVVMGSGLMAQVYRYFVVSGPVQKQQSKLVVFGMVAVAGVLVLLFVLNPGLGAGLSDLAVVTPRVEALYNLILLTVLGLALLLLPVSIGFSVLRYRLWDIDLFINRTLVYGALTAILGIAYFSIVFGIGAIAGRSYVTVAAATLSVAAAFEPLRRKLQSLIDRYFFRRRYDAGRTLDEFMARMRQQIDLESLSLELLKVVEFTVAPAGVSLWTPKKPESGSDGGEQVMHRIAFRAAGTINGPDFVEATLDGDSVFALREAHGPVDLRNEWLLPTSLGIFRRVNVTLTVPLVSQGEFVGMLNLGPRLSETDYSTEDLSLLAKLADQAAAAVRVALLVREHEADMRERERIENEMQVAQLIQQQFLPKELPHLQGWGVHAYYHPAREVGGDFYDFIDLPDGRLCVVAGDVTGKGVPAALVMATTRSILRSEAPRRLSPGEVLRVANDQLVSDIPPNMFVTCLCAILDPVTGRTEFANAGHNLPYLQHEGEITELRATGMPLGLMPGVTYDESATVLLPGHNFILHSDGITEAHNANREMFGFGRLKSLIRECSEPEAVINHLLNELNSFTEPGWEQEDDITLVVLHRFDRARHPLEKDLSGAGALQQEIEMAEAARISASRRRAEMSSERR
jgi:serine phosphatase RsbU (regulator of sigma subunit)